MFNSGEQSENPRLGMKINGNGLSDKGFTIDELKLIQLSLSEINIDSSYYNLNDYVKILKKFINY